MKNKQEFLHPIVDKTEVKKKKIAAIKQIDLKQCAIDVVQ